MRRALFALMALAAAAPAGAQSYDRYGGGGGYNAPVATSGQARVLTWAGKQTAPAQPMMMAPPGFQQGGYYPSQAYPGGYPQYQYGTACLWPDGVWRVVS